MRNLCKPGRQLQTEKKWLIFCVLCVTQNNNFHCEQNWTIRQLISSLHLQLLHIESISTLWTLQSNQYIYKYIQMIIRCTFSGKHINLFGCSSCSVSVVVSSSKVWYLTGYSTDTGSWIQVLVPDSTFLYTITLSKEQKCFLSCTKIRGKSGLLPFILITRYLYSL